MSSHTGQVAKSLQQFTESNEGGRLAPHINHLEEYIPVNELRLILLILGTIIVLALYVTGRRKKTPPMSEPIHSEEVETSSEPHAVANVFPAVDDSAQTLAQDVQMQSLLREYDEAADWDNLDDMDLEWLEDSTEDINYDELMYQLNQSQPGSAMSENGGGYWQPFSRPGEKVFVSVKKPDTRKVKQAVSAAQQVDPIVLIMHVLAPNGSLFNGVQVQSAMKALGLRYGDMGLFHAYTRASNFGEAKHPQRVFSVTNALEPGSFDKSKLDSLRTPGLTLLLQLPGPIENNAAFDWFYRTGKELARKLDGVLCDESRNVMTQQCINHMKDQISEFNIKIQLSQHPRIH